MARPVKTGLDYFPLHIDFFDDIRICALAVQYGTKGQLAAIILLVHLYKTGYYLLWDDDTRVRVLKDMPGVTFDAFQSAGRPHQPRGAKTLLQRHQASQEQHRTNAVFACRNRQHARRLLNTAWRSPQKWQCGTAACRNGVFANRNGVSASSQYARV